MGRLRTIDLFSGIGGFALALLPVCKPVAYCDIHPDARSVLQSAMRRGQLPRAPVLEDVRKFNSRRKVDVVTAGFPCQDVSVMNRNGSGVKGLRSGLVFEVVRIAVENGASAIFLENSPNLESRGLADVISALEYAGYSRVAWGTFSASEVGAPHLRKRLYLLAMKSHEKAYRTVKTLTDIYRTPSAAETLLPNFLKDGCSGYTARVIRKTPRTLADLSARGFLLGNSVVPLCSRKACHELATMLLDQRTNANANANANASVLVRLPISSSPQMKAWTEELELHVPGSKSIPPSTKDTVHKRWNWSTPLSMRWNATQVGSRRALQILPNQILYEKETRAYMVDRGNADVDAWVVNPRFVECLMGYPVGWTENIHRK